MLTGNREAGKPFSAVFPHLATASRVPTLVKIEDVDWSSVDGALCCLPHGTTQATVASLPSSVKVVDLSADFRLRDPATYEQWYGSPHAAVELQKEVAYGLTELNREAVRAARVVANPGCYPTCTQLALVPLLRRGLVLADDVILDAKSGVSGAGRSAKVGLLYTEIAQGMAPYGVGSHRHMPEIEQGLADAVEAHQRARARGGPVDAPPSRIPAPLRVSFTPHLVPFARGMEVDAYVKLAPGASPDDLRAALAETYADEPFVRVLPAGELPRTHHVRGTNFAHVAVFPDRIPGRAVVVSVIDNLVKGASGQAIQNLNILLGLDETTALKQQALYP